MGIDDDFLALPIENPQVEPLDEPLDLDDIRNSLKSLMWRNVGVRRDGEGSGRSLAERRALVPLRAGPAIQRPAAWELQNMLTIARLMIRAALAREESRGCHVRTDFPARDDAHGNHHITFRASG